MSPFVLTLIGATIVVASFISGTFGMAGGMVLLGVLLIYVPVTTAMVVFSTIQFFANGWRVVSDRRGAGALGTGEPQARLHLSPLGRGRLRVAKSGEGVTIGSMSHRPLTPTLSPAGRGSHAVPVAMPSRNLPAL